MLELIFSWLEQHFWEEGGLYKVNVRAIHHTQGVELMSVEAIKASPSTSVRLPCGGSFTVDISWPKVK